MIDSLIRWSLSHRMVVLAAACALLVLGTLEALQTPVDVFPDLTAPTVTILADAHGMAALEVETLVTFPIEAALNGAPAVRRVRSATGVGAATVWVEFDWGTDIYRARQVVSEKLQLVRPSLPPEIDPPILAPISSIMGEVQFLALTSDTVAPEELRAIADWTLRRRILAVPGVAQVLTIGGEVGQYQVLLDPDRLAAYELRPQDVHDAVAANSENVSAGFLVEGGKESLIHGFGRVRNVDEIAETVVDLRDGEPILVRHLGEVVLGHAIKRGEGSYNEQPAVILSVQKQPTANTLALTARLARTLDELESGLPKGVRLHRDLFRQADFISLAIENVTKALRDGALLVVLIVFIFLGSLRSTAVTALAIPLSLLITIIVLRAFDITINTMTLGGMAIAVGALVDDAIVDVENVVRRLREDRALPLEQRRPVIEIVYNASREIRASIVIATLVILLVFVPLFFLSGVEGRLLRPLGIAYIVSLSASLLVALTVTPVLCALWLPHSRTIKGGKETTLVRLLKRGYEPLLRRTLPRWRIVAVVSLALLSLSLWGLMQAGQAFLPAFNEGALTISAVTLPGTSLAESDRLGRRVENVLRSFPEVQSVSRRTGRGALDEHALTVNSAEIDARLDPEGRSQAELLVDLREALGRIPGLTTIVGQPISHRIDHMLSGSRASIAVKVFGDDLLALRQTAERARRVMATIPGIVDLNIEQQPDTPQLTVRFDRAAIARHGMRIRDVTEALEAALSGHVVNRVLQGSRSWDLVVRFRPDAVDTVEELRALLVPTPDGAQVPLEAVAELRRDAGPHSITRENTERKVVVVCNVAGRDLASVVEDVRAGVRREVPLPPGVHVELGGQFESAESAQRRLLLLGALVLAGVLVLLIGGLGSLRDALLVLVNLPLALIGGVVGVHVAGGVASIASVIGFIALFGIATRNGLMLVTHIRHLRGSEPELSVDQAITQGALERLSPILMTALASALALVPLALAGGKPGSEIETPMAIVILFGLVSSTLLNMLVVPALYRRFGERAR